MQTLVLPLLLLLLLLLSRFSHVRLRVTPQTAAHQAPPSMGFSRQEYWSGLPLPSPRLWYQRCSLAQACTEITKGVIKDNLMKTIWNKKYKHITLNQPGHDSSPQTVSTVHSGIYNNSQPGLRANSYNTQGHGQRRCSAFYLIYLSPDISSSADPLFHDSHCPVGMLTFQYSSQLISQLFILLNKH